MRQHKVITLQHSCCTNKCANVSNSLRKTRKLCYETNLIFSLMSKHYTNQIAAFLTTRRIMPIQTRPHRFMSQVDFVFQNIVTKICCFFLKSCGGNHLFTCLNLISPFSLKNQLYTEKSSYAHPHVAPNLYVFLSQKMSNCQSCSFPNAGCSLVVKLSRNLKQ